MPHPNGFYTGRRLVGFRFERTVDGWFTTEFELGMELDSAEVRGILIYEGQDWGHVVFDFRA
jgi:hypothetical protein